MKKNIVALLLAGSVAVSMMVPAVVYAGEAQETETEAGAQALAVSSAKIENGVMTIYIESDETDPDWWWAYSQEDMEDSCTELITDSTDEGYAYVGSFKAVDDCEDAVGMIRLIHTDGFCTDQYMDFEVKIEDGKITENTGGSHAMPTFAEDLAEVLEGTWAEKNEGVTMLEISLGEDNGLDMVMSDGSGKDGQTSFYTMTARFDAVKNALVYNNGTQHEDAAITDGSQEQTEADAEQGTGAGVFELIPNEDGTAIAELHWTNSEGGAVVFVPAEQ